MVVKSTGSAQADFSQNGVASVAGAMVEFTVEIQI